MQKPRKAAYDRKESAAAIDLKCGIGYNDSVKRVRKNLQYSSAPRRMHLDETRFGPILKFALMILALIVFTLAVVFLLVPAMTRWFSKLSVPFSEGQSGSPAAEAAQQANNPILGNLAQTISAEGAAALADVSVYDGQLLFAAGADAAHCDRLVRLNPQTGEQSVITLSLTYDTLRYPHEDADSIVYLDAKTEGGGNICLFDKNTGETHVVYKVAFGAPRLCYEAPYLVFTEWTGDNAASLYVCDLDSGEALALATFSASPYAASAPSLRSGQVLYADAGEGGNSLIRTVLLQDGARWDYAAGMYVHDPKTAGDRWAWISGDHGTDSDLYVSVQGGQPALIARGVIDFAITSTCVVYNRDETVFAYSFLDDKTYVLSQTAHNCQLLTAEGDYAVWQDVTDAAHPVWRYIRVV